MKKFLLLLITILTAVSVRAEEVWRDRQVEIVDDPTAQVVDHYGYRVAFRFGQDGNLQTKTMFGIFPRLNLGFSLDGEQIIGSKDSTRLNTPALNAKFRLYDGKGLIPAMAFGYDGQGYIYNKTTDEYEERQIGFFASMTSELLVPESNFTIGVNRADFKEGDNTFGYAGWTYVYRQTLGALVEADHATDSKQRRINYGLKYYVTPLFTVEGIGRYKPEFFGASHHVTERIVRLAYTGTF